jgi:RimJ/RimL family protein N-acetyltransferase
VEHCVEHGLTPHWHCWEDNAPSMRVAEKVGFVRPERYAVYRFEW